MKDNRLSRTPEQLDAEVARVKNKPSKRPQPEMGKEAGTVNWGSQELTTHRVLGAGVSGAGVLRAGPPGLVSPTPEMRRSVVAMMKDRMVNAQALYEDALYVGKQPHARDVDFLILWQAHQNRLVLLWMAQTLHLVELCDEFQRMMTLDDIDHLFLRNAQRVAEARERR